MNRTELAEQFEQHRPYLRRLAYSTLGSIAEADDVVQEAWIRLQRTDSDQIENLRAWLAKVTGRIALDQLGSARARREEYVGSWLPEPAVIADDDPADRVSQAERVTTALLVVLESLSPAERTAFVLHEVFGMPGPEVAEVVGRTPAAVRQLVSRARKRVQEGTPRFPPTPEEQKQVVSAFKVAWQAGNIDALLQVLDPEVTFTSDGGGKVTATRKPVHGAKRVAELLAGWARLDERRDEQAKVTGNITMVNDEWGLVLFDGTVMTVLSITVDDGKIIAVDAVRNPDKLRHIPPPGE